MKPIGFVVRDGAGAVQRSEISGEGAVTPIAAGSGQEISLNLRQGDIQGYQRLGPNLQITLIDGRVVVLEDFFGPGGTENARLFISADGYLNEVDLAQGADGSVLASYGPAEQWGKWSPSDDLMFLESTEVAHAAPVTDEEVSMLGAGLLSGLGGMGLAGAGAAAGGLALLRAGGGGGAQRIDPTVDQDGVLSIGGDGVTDADKVIVISGTAEPGSEVRVTIGDQILTTTSDDNGVWRVEFEGDSFPADGSYDVAVVVTEQSGIVTDLDGPDVVIDLTPPDLQFDDGVKSVGDLTNAADHADGVEIGGTGEPGARVEVTIEGVTHQTVVAADGSWGVVFSPTELPGGEYETGVTVVTTDAHGNSTTVTDAVVIDTLASVGIDSGQAGGDDLIDAAEQAAGVTLTGTAEAGASVEVTLAGVSHTVTADAGGHWSAVFASSEIPTGETQATVTAVATDAAGNTARSEATIRIDTVNAVTFDAAGVEGDGTVNAAERADGVTLTGTTQPGSTVSVQIAGATYAAVVDGAGNWSVDLPAADVPQGETQLQVDVTSLDGAGNSATTSGTVEIDTLVRDLALTGAPGGADGVVNAAEAAAGLTLTGTVEPGSSVVVDMGGVRKTATVDAVGNWSAAFAPGEIPAGNHDLPVTATATDAAGNVDTVTGTVAVDTLVENLAFTPGPVESDDVINLAERADGVPLSGTVEPGSAVTVTMGGVSQAAVVDAAGNWSTTFPLSAIAEGEYDTTIEVHATDAAGNTDSISRTVRVDTLVNMLENDPAPIEGDNVVNAAEARDGITLAGRVEPGSSVEVEFGGARHAATVDGTGAWSVDIPASAIAAGEYTAQATIHATDEAGNSASITRDIQIDTVLPDAPDLASYTRDHSGIRGISIETTSDAVDIAHVHHDGSITQIGANGVEIPVLGETTYAFNPTIPDGSHLVVSATDAAGNMSSTYLVLDESSTSVVNMSNPNLGALQVEAIDLQFAEDSQLTITEAQLRALSDNSDTVVIHGGIDDTVTALGAVRTGQTVDVNGEIHEVYTLGESGTLIIDDDINVVI